MRTALGISTASASRVIADFVRERPGQFEFSNQARAFVPVQGFKSTVEIPSFNDYLRIVGAPADVTVVSQPIDQTFVVASVYQAMLRAIRDGCGVDVTYASLHFPAGEVHQMFPSAFVQMNGRWHVRAWSSQRASYRDFVLSRFLEIKLREQKKPDGLPIDEGGKALSNCASLRILLSAKLSND